MARNTRSTAPRRRTCRRTAIVITLLGVGNPTFPLAQASVSEPVVTRPVEPGASRENAVLPVPPATAPSPTHAAPGNWPRVQLADPVARHMAGAALDLAWQRLGRAACGAVLNGFTDASGTPLAQRLATVSVDAQSYLTMVVFIDGTREAPCRSGVLAFTSPGSRVVRICVDQFKQAWLQSPVHTSATIIHEVLHTLGLSENPPSSAEITNQVLAACFRRR